MSGTALYRALIEAGASEETAGNAASQLDRVEQPLTALDIKINILLAIAVAILIKSFF